MIAFFVRAFIFLSDHTESFKIGLSFFLACLGILVDKRVTDRYRLMYFLLIKEAIVGCRSVSRLYDYYQLFK